MEYVPLIGVLLAGINAVALIVVVPLILRVRDLKDQQLERIEQRVVNLETKMDSHMLLHLNMKGPGL